MATYGIPTPPSPEAIKLGYQVSYRDLPQEAVKPLNRRSLSYRLAISKTANNMINYRLGSLHQAKTYNYGTQDAY